jgi:hypothetical protein
MAYVPGDNSGKEQINQFNLWMRQQPWYQQWFQARGLNPNQVKLSKAQREDLERTILQNGGVQRDAFNDMMIDPAGNLNTEHGFASLPTWAKVATIGGAAAAGGFGAAALAGGAGGGVGAGGLGSGMNAATAGAAAHAGSPLMMGTGGLMATGAGAGAAAIPTIGSQAIGSGMGYGPASLAGTSSVPTASEILATIASRQIGNGMGTDPASLAGTGAAAGAANAANGLGGQLGNAAKSALTSDGTPSWLGDVLKQMAGIAPAIMASQANNGPSDEEKAYADQARRLLAQQEQRTQYQNPLYEYITKSVYGLQPNTGGAAYPINSLNDVKIPGMS